MAKFNDAIAIPTDCVKYAREWGLLLRELMENDEFRTSVWTPEAVAALEHFVELNNQIEQAKSTEPLTVVEG